MVLSRRERAIAIVTLLAVGILMGDRFVLGPLLARYDRLALQKQQAEAALTEAAQLRMREEQLAQGWSELKQEGLRQDPAATESLVMHAVRDWSSRSGLSLGSLRPERTRELKVRDVPEPVFREVTFRASGTGTMRQVTGFMKALETSELPVRITELQLGSRKEGADDLSLQLKISALCLPEPAGSRTPRTEKAARND